MGVMDVIRSRRSVRKWKDQPVKKEQLQVLMEAAQQAPSAVNWQPYRFVLVDDPEKRKEVSRATYQRFVSKAPLLIIGVADPKTSPQWHLIDTVIALTQMMLAAYELGLAGVWIGVFDETSVKKVLGVPEDLVVAGILALGVPNQKPDPITRKSTMELFAIDSYSQSIKP
nr:nitroreductase family protein [Candidatus Njordarchaeum guaymaensis]